MSYYIAVLAIRHNKIFPISSFFIRALYPRGFHQLLPLQSGAVLVLGPSERARCLWQLDDVAPQGWKKKSDGSSSTSLAEEKRDVDFSIWCIHSFWRWRKMPCSPVVLYIYAMTREKENLSTYHDEPFSSATILQTLWAVKVLLNQKLLFLLAATHQAQIISLFANLCCRVGDSIECWFCPHIWKFPRSLWEVKKFGSPSMALALKIPPFLCTLENKREKLGYSRSGWKT